MVLMTKKILIAVGSIVGVTIPTALAITYTKDPSGSSNEKIIKNLGFNEILKEKPKPILSSSANGKSVFELTIQDFEFDKNITYKGITLTIKEVKAGIPNGKTESDGKSVDITIEVQSNKTHNKKDYTVNIGNFKTPKQLWDDFLNEHEARWLLQV